MSICANRMGDGVTTCYRCKCGEDVRAELEDQDRREGAGVRPNDNGGAGGHAA